MIRSSLLKRRLLYLLLGLALLQLGWLQLQHDIEYHLHQPDQSCEFCVFAGHLGNGITGHLPLPPRPFHNHRLMLPVYESPVSIAEFLYSNYLRGPPLFSKA